MFGAQTWYVQKLPWLIGHNFLSGLCSNDVCSESKLQSGQFRAQTWYVHLWQFFSNTTLYTVRLQLYKSCTMMFALESMIYPRITMVDQYSDIREHLQTFNADYLGKWTYHDCALSTRNDVWLFVSSCVRYCITQVLGSEFYFRSKTADTTSICEIRITSIVVITFRRWRYFIIF